VAPDFRRVPLASSAPVALFAAARVVISVVALVVVLVLGLSYDGKLAGMLAGVFLPWSLFVLYLARVHPEAALSPWIAVGDFAVLGATQIVVPEVYGPFRFVALFLVSVHATFQGERRGVAIAALGSASVIVSDVIAGEGPIGGDLLIFYETLFTTVAIASALVIGRLRVTESASRLRARDLTRRTLRGEGEVRRRVAEAIHDGPVQELIGLDMRLAVAGQAAQQGDAARSRELIDEARELAQRNVQSLRDEIVDLGPFAFEELSFAQAVENCVPTWQRRYDFEVMLTLETVELAPEVAGHLFRITQEAAVNAGRHGHAKHLGISLRTFDGSLELRVTDDGEGFGDTYPLRDTAPGHLGLATMRERAEMLGGMLEIETGEKGTRVLVTAPRE
jgi:signal transduction histidine kinase